MKFLQRRFQQLFTGLVLCVVHLGESPNYRSLLKFKGKKRLTSNQLKPVVTTIASFIVAARDFGERVSVSLRRYYFSEQQSGKDVCDRILCPLKGAVRRYCNEGHDVLTASDMHKALKKGQFKNVPQLCAT